MGVRLRHVGRKSPNPNKGIGVALSSDMEHGLDVIQLPGWGRFVDVDGVVLYQVHGSDEQPIEPIRRYPRGFVFQGRRVVKEILAARLPITPCVGGTGDLEVPPPVLLTADE